MSERFPRLAVLCTPVEVPSGLGQIRRQHSTCNVKPIPKPELLLPTHTAWLRPALRALFPGQANRKVKTEVSAMLVTSPSQTFCVWLSHVSAVLLLTQASQLAADMGFGVLGRTLHLPQVLPKMQPRI